MGNAEDLAFHFALSVGDDSSKTALQFLYDDAGIHARRRQNSGRRSRRRVRREEPQTESLYCSSGHGCDGLRVIYQLDATLREIAIRLARDVVERCAQSGD